MFQFETLFVIGAGASAEMQFPTGAALTEIIKRKLSRDPNDVSFLSDREIHNALLAHVNQTSPESPTQYSLSDYIEAAVQMSGAMPLSTSIDTYMDDHQGDPRVQLCGRLAIVKSIMEAEKESNRYFRIEPPQVGSVDKLDFDKLTPTWFVHFFKTLREGGISTEKVVSIFDRLSVISFNYDRSLEHFLVQAMCTYYTISEPEAEGILQKLGIFHPYGTVGPWCEGCDHQPFGKVRNSPQELLRLAQRIHTYTESSVHSEEVKRTVSKAEVIIFLGFGYISENLKLLRPRDEHTRSTRQIYGTAYGLSEPNKVIITSVLSSFLAPRLGARVPGAQPPVDLFNGKCAALFDEYSFAMTSR